jgi:FkbM family methyltransferase
MIRQMDRMSRSPRAARINLLLLAAVIVLLGVEVVRSVGNLRNELDRTKSVATQAALADSGVGPGSNQVPAEILAPRLLDDHDDLESFLDQFARDHYRVFVVKGQGSFHLDDGRDEIKDELRMGRMWKPQLVKLLAQRVRPGSTAIDVGAHIGTHTMVMAWAVGKQGRVYAFEPRRRSYRELYYNLQLNGLRNVVPLRFAVGDEPAVIEMNPGTGEPGGGSGGDQAELRSIDSFGFHNVSVIKIDVDGSEDHVLQGARRTITRDRPILIFEIQSGADFNTARPELRAKIVHTIQVVEQMGYLVTRQGVADYLGAPRGMP